MKILIVEDSKNRIRKFYNLLGHHEIIATNYAEGAIDLLKTQAFDLIFLDYDLREGQSKVGIFTEYWSDNLKEAYYQTEKLTPPVVVIHSLNSLGAEKMKVHLNSLGIKHYRIEFFDILRSDLTNLSKVLGMNL